MLQYATDVGYSKQIKSDSEEDDALRGGGEDEGNWNSFKQALLLMAKGKYKVYIGFKLLNSVLTGM